MDSDATLILQPIGYIETPFRSKADAPHQPDGNTGVEGVIHLYEGRNFEQALEDLEGIEKIWLIYWFDRNPNWKPKVLVPRGRRQKRGVFATRSPHRPNPIGLTLADIVSIEGLNIKVRNIDLLDGTPILDIKPYLPAVEAHPNASAGWIDEVEYASLGYSVSFSSLAQAQLQFLEDYDVRLRDRILRVLSNDPSPHPYKRIEQANEGFVQAIRGWRIIFEVTDDGVLIREIESAYSREMLMSAEPLSDDTAQRAFYEKFKVDM